MLLVKITAFKKLSQDGLATYTNNVITLMTAAPQFASLSEDVAELKKCYDAYATALTNNVNGGRIATIQKDVSKKAVENQLTSVALLVDFMAKSNEQIVLAAGFDVRKTEMTSYSALTAPIVLKIVNEKEAGIVSLELEKVPGATNYGIEKRIKVEGQPDSPWTNGEYTSACKTKLTGLESGKYYEWRFRAVGNKGLVSAWSAVVGALVS